MKKVKLILSAIAILASVGGALAFKAHSAYSGGNVYVKATAGATNCLLRVTTLRAETIGDTFTINTATFPVPGPCVSTITVVEGV